LKTPNVVYPRPPQMTSIPAMLSLFQNEWDALALQTYTLQQNLYQVRQELSTALYENDAAVRVIAQLTKERDEARSALSQISVNGGGSAATNGDAMQVDSKPLPQHVVEAIQSTQARYGNLAIVRKYADTLQPLKDSTEETSTRRMGNCRLNIVIHSRLNFRTTLSLWDCLDCTRIW
jgi:hypothetical protein